MEINSINSSVAEAGQTGRALQAPQRSFTPQSAGTVAVPGQPASNADEAPNVERVQEIRPDSADQAARLEQAVRESVEKINEFIRPYVTSLQFSLDKDLGKIVVKIMDSETNEVIKQFPSEEALALAKALEKVAGLFLKQVA
ncbi:MAG: flagellar protein FlaG [Azoarcus sp.]|nr:flagellar protein FlaG [Azoarcus sp.]